MDNKTKTISSERTVEKVKVFILHPSYDYGVEGIFFTRKGAEDRLEEIYKEADRQWELYKQSESYNPEINEDNFFRLPYYIQEIEVS
jgi:hypothetical protein